MPFWCHLRICVIIIKRPLRVSFVISHSKAYELLRYILSEIHSAEPTCLLLRIMERGKNKKSIENRKSKRQTIIVDMESRTTQKKLLNGWDIQQQEKRWIFLDSVHLIRGGSERHRILYDRGSTRSHSRRRRTVITREQGEQSPSLMRLYQKRRDKSMPDSPAKIEWTKNNTTQFTLKSIITQTQI